MDFGVPRLISIAILIFLFVAAITGLRKGLGRVLVNLIKVIGPFILSFFLAKPVGSLLGSFGLKDFFFNQATTFIAEHSGETANTVITEENYSEILGRALNKINIPESFRPTIINFIKDKNLIETGSTANASISTALSTFACYAVAFIALLIIGFIIIIILKGVFKTIDKIPLIGTLDKLLGCVLNVGFALFICAALIWGFQLLQTAFPDLNDAANTAFALDDPDYQTISKFMYNHNIILWVFNLIF